MILFQLGYCLEIIYTCDDVLVSPSKVLPQALGRVMFLQRWRIPGLALEDRLRTGLVTVFQILV